MGTVSATNREAIFDGAVVKINTIKRSSDTPDEANNASNT